MKSQSQQSIVSGSLTSEHWNVPIRVRLVPYVQFSRWMDEELERLVERWTPTPGVPVRQSAASSRKCRT